MSLLSYVSQLLFFAVPNPPTLTATPLYDSSGGLLEIESQATEGVSRLCMNIYVCIHFVTKAQ